MGIARRHVIVGLLALGLAGSAVMLTRAEYGDRRGRGRVSADPTALGGPFSLVDHTGRPVTDQDYRGKFMLVFFGYTMCPDICPTTLLDITTVMEKLGDDAQRVQPLFISVDPERDTPEVLASYLSSFHPQIIGLTGTPQEIHRAATAYKTFYAKFVTEGKDYSIDHSAYVYLMGPDGGYLTHFAFGATSASMTNDIRDFIIRKNLSGK